MPNPLKIEQPARDAAAVTVELSPSMVANLMIAERFIGIANGYGNGPGAHCGKGERIAGFYYPNGRARDEEIFPARSIGAIRELVLDLATAIRNGDPHHAQ